MQLLRMKKIRAYTGTSRADQSLPQIRTARIHELMKIIIGQGVGAFKHCRFLPSGKRRKIPTRSSILSDLEPGTIHE
ncbi:MAG TPA: hypothetical protein PK156_24030 [Polyangium sp.]|nr:hypothetical protein [Polyangium sp.]